MTKPNKAPTVFIPLRHQAAPNVDPKGPLYKQKRGSTLFLPTLPECSENDTELKSGLAVANSIIHGLGLFADRIFHQHDTVWQERLTGKIGQPEDDGPLRWTNHSDNPNCVLLIDLEKQEVGLIAKQAIVIDEEITYDYKNFGHAGVRAECNCRQENCPGFFTLREEWGERR